MNAHAMSMMSVVFGLVDWLTGAKSCCTINRLPSLTAPRCQYTITLKLDRPMKQGSPYLSSPSHHGSPRLDDARQSCLLACSPPSAAFSNRGKTFPCGSEVVRSPPPWLLYLVDSEHTIYNAQRERPPSLPYDDAGKKYIPGTK
jgi:hypothetical protein